MSTDLSVWSVEPFNLPAQLPDADMWERFPREWCYPGEGWQVLVQAVEAENEPVCESIAEAMPAAKYVAYVTLEPIGADMSGYRQLDKVVRTLARSSGGLWVDPNDHPFDADSGQIA